MDEGHGNTANGPITVQARALRQHVQPDAMRKRLPHSLRSAIDGEAVHLRARRGPAVVALLHASPCAACDTGVRTLLASRAALSEWGGFIALVTDPDAELELNAPALLIADEWGEIYFAVKHDHQLPAEIELLEWVRYIAIQCPECEQPEGEWRHL